MVDQRMERRMRAADPTVSAWVAANAGAGKTHTLASRVTRLLLAGAEPERILCLTYTKAAAAEMAKRLFDQLGEWSMLGDAALAEKITALGADPGGKDNLRAARRLFAKALETPGGLKIQTIHAFCQYVLNRFPIEAGVPPHFRVLDERSARDLISEAQAHVLERAASGDTVRQAAIAYLVTHLSEMRLAQILDCALGADRGKVEAFFERAGGPENDWSALLRAAHGAAPEDTEQSVAGAFCAELKRDEDVLREAIAWLASGGKSDQERSAGLAAAVGMLGELERYEGMCSVLLTKDGEPRKALATKKLADARPELALLLLKVGTRLLDYQERLRAVRAAQLAEAALTIVHAVREDYVAMKRARNVLDYDDLIVDAHRLLNERGAAWVLYKLDGGIDHVLIDEAQDTSTLQWEIIQKLTEEFFAGEGAERPLRTLFAVGDEKQSIFSFQGANPAQFEVQHRLFAQRAADGQREFLYEPLQNSWRSAPEILAFVDQTFVHPDARDGLTSSNAAPEHHALKKDLKGCVEFWPAIPAPDAPDRDPWDLRPVDAPRESSPVVQLANQIAGRIKDWLAAGAALPGSEKPIEPGDIMILLPRREPFGSEIIRRLKERGVPVAGADRLVLTEQIAVMDLIALGRFALLPEDDLNLAALLRSPLLGLSEEELFTLAHGRKGSLWESVSEHRDGFAQQYALLTDARARADFSPPFEFHAHALIEGRRKILKRLGPEANDAIDEFLSLALTYEQANTPSLEGFLHWIERGGAEVKRDMERGRNEVRVMTVHGAKGLEADIVILADTTRMPNDATGNGQLLYDGSDVLFPVPNKAAPERVRLAREAANDAVKREYRRLLYVALTRAKQRLIICGFETKRGTQPGSWHTLAQRAAEALGVPGEGGARIFGEAACKPVARTREAAAEEFTLPGWARTPAKTEKPAPWLIRPSDAAGMDEPAMPSPFDSTSSMKRGLLVHAMLARLPEAPADDREELAMRFLRANGIDAAEAEMLTAQTLAVLNDPAFAAAFAPGSRAEVSLVADLPEIGPAARVHGRVDRLSVTADAVLILDFKTGRPALAEADVPALYLSQMALYRAAMSRIYPGKRIACALVWTENPSLMPLSAGVLDAEITRIRARLDPGGSPT
jgi:ATP-dependent helicase/nuclease subunit A